MEDYAGNVSTVNIGATRVLLKVMYPHSPILKIMDLATHQLDYTNNLSKIYWNLLVTKNNSEETWTDQKWYIIDDVTANRPEGYDPRWLEYSPQQGVTLPSASYFRMYGEQGIETSSYNPPKGYLNKMFYAWFKNSGGYVSLLPSVARITVDVTAPSATLNYLPLQGTTDAQLKLTLNTSEGVTVYGSKMIHSDGVNSFEFIGSGNLWLTTNLGVRPSKHPLFSTVIQDYAGNQTTLDVDLQPYLQISSINCVTQSVSRLDKDITLLRIEVSASTKVILY